MPSQAKLNIYRVVRRVTVKMEKATESLASVLKVPPADLTTLARRNGGYFPLTAVSEIIDGRTLIAAHGTREMPIWGFDVRTSKSHSCDCGLPYPHPSAVRRRLQGNIGRKVFRFLLPSAAVDNHRFRHSAELGE